MVMDIKKFLYSIRMRVIAAVVVMSLLSGLVIEIIYNINVNKVMTDTNQHYVEDVAIAYGSMIELQISHEGKEAILNAAVLTEELKGVGMEGMDSSYVYVVSPDGTMLYHPNADKIGQKVENAAVSSIIEKIKNGKTIKNEVIEYEFEDEIKYAGTYVDSNKNFILVVKVDETEIFEPIDQTRMKGVISLVIMVIVSIGLAVLTAQLIIKPINQLAALTLALADMDFRDNENYAKLIKRKDETGTMSRALAKLREALVDAISIIRVKSDVLMESVEALNTSASETTTTMGQIENAVNDIAQGASSQAEDTQNATENVLEMGTLIEDTNTEARTLLAYASGMQESAEHANEILVQLNDINNKAEECIEIIANQTNNTNESALKISEATKIITSIAEETNLLSLNASIEAARAGEQGRGFAVVAAEIQKLAEQSNESAQRIEAIIHELIADSEKAVETMDNVKTIIKTQSEHVEQTAGAFAHINDGVQSSIKGINAISSKAEQLDYARANVVDLVQNLTAIAQENAASSQETSASVTEISSIVDSISDRTTNLKDIAEELEERMSIFKI